MSMTRRAFLLAVLAALSACAEQAAPPPVATGPDPDPEPEDVYCPGAIPWADLTEEHKRRARRALARMASPSARTTTPRCRPAGC